jgi:acyl-CoA thioesterase FadM
MTTWTETYRGTVPPWQCDMTEHFTVSCYFDRVEEAESNLGEALNLGTLLRRAEVPLRIIGRFERELRAGASFHVESAALSVADGLRLGHRFVDSASGAIVTWFHEHWDLATAPLTAEQRATIGSRVADWNGPAPEPRPDVAATGGFIPTARGWVRPADVTVAGQFALGAIVWRFSNAAGQLSAALGMDRATMQQMRRGFSTFEQNLQISGALPVDTPYLVETGIAQLGNSSLRMIHRMTNPRTGAEVARLSQYGVNLDLDARRPARWSEEIRARAAPLLVPAA